MRTLQRITILGPGLLGGSVALAAQAAGLEVTLWGRKAARVEAARELGLDATTDLEAAAAHRDLLILAVPVGAMAALAGRLQGHLRPGALVTDVGSVKALPHAMAAAHGLPFIGSHPMAGSEQTGIAAARPDLLEGAVCVVTNEAARDEEEVAAVCRFWEQLGCRTRLMGATEHDRAVARISHLPHAMAVVTASAGLRFEGDRSLAAGGFRDTTRVASGDPAMWAEIMMENREALGAALRDAQNEIGEMLAQLANSDQKDLQNYLAAVKQRKENPNTTE